MNSPTKYIKVTAKNPYAVGTLEALAFDHYMTKINTSVSFWVSDWKWLLKNIPREGIAILYEFSGDRWDAYPKELQEKLKQTLSKITGAVFHD